LELTFIKATACRFDRPYLHGSESVDMRRDGARAGFRGQPSRSICAAIRRHGAGRRFWWATVLPAGAAAADAVIDLARGGHWRARDAPGTPGSMGALTADKSFDGLTIVKAECGRD
jgi:hypothetical protein